MRPILQAPQIGFITLITGPSGTSVAPPVPAASTGRQPGLFLLPPLPCLISQQNSTAGFALRCTHHPTSQTQTLGVTPMKEFGSHLTVLPACKSCSNNGLENPDLTVGKFHTLSQFLHL